MNMLLDSLHLPLSGPRRELTLNLLQRAYAFKALNAPKCKPTPSPLTPKPDTLNRNSPLQDLNDTAVAAPAARELLVEGQAS